MIGSAAPARAAAGSGQHAHLNGGQGLVNRGSTDGVNGWASYAFCIGDGGFLPSEAEWEYAAVTQTRWGRRATATASDAPACRDSMPTDDHTGVRVGEFEDEESTETPSLGTGSRRRSYPPITARTRALSSERISTALPNPSSAATARRRSSVADDSPADATNG